MLNMMSLGSESAGGGSAFPTCILGLSDSNDTGIFQKTFSFKLDFDITVSFATTYRSNQILLGDNHTTALYFNISETSGISVWSENDSWNFSTAGLDLWDGREHTIVYRRRSNLFQLEIDGINSEIATVSDTPYTGDNNFKIGDSNLRHDYFRGSILRVHFKDYNDPENTLGYDFNSGSLIYELPNGHTGDETSPLALLYQNFTTDNWVCGVAWLHVGFDGVNN